MSRSNCGWVMAVIVLTAFPAGGQELSRWTIVAPESIGNHAAFRLALRDLEKAGEELGIAFTLAGDETTGNIIAILEPAGPAPKTITAQSQSYEISTHDTGDGRRIEIRGATDIARVYALYWIWDRMRVFKTIPEINVTRSPALYIRAGSGESRVLMENSLRYTVNWVTGANITDIVPWDSEPEATVNAGNRAMAQELIEHAHALGMKFLAYGDEFAYHPSLLEKSGATLSPDDPALWAALQEKYRMLFSALPGIDGVRIRTGELTQVYGSYAPYDVMHEPPSADWPLERRYRTFVQKLHEVVVGEFDKIYYHRTWVTNTTEQHSSPEVYKAIFTNEVPQKNLYLSPYITLADRWLYQPINPTFNLTPHKMLVLLPSLNYHASNDAGVFPIYPGRYFSEGLAQILAHEDSNVAGAQFGAPGGDVWDGNAETIYAAYRLAWEPAADPREIARDFAAIHFGLDAAEKMADIYMLSFDAYKDGIYIKPVAESIVGNTLPHLRLTTFPVQGFPAIDRGKAHIEWLRDTMYDPSSGRLAESAEHLDRGLATADRMLALGREAAPLFDDPAAAAKIVESLELTRHLIRTNVAYVKTCYSFFDYRIQPTELNRRRLEDNVTALDDAAAEFGAAPGFRYKLYGIAQLLKNAKAILADFSTAEFELTQALDREQIEAAIASQQTKHAAAIDALGDEAAKVLHWKGMVDGEELLTIAGKSIDLEHLKHDPPHSIEHEFSLPLPKIEGTVLVKNVQSAAMHPFVLEQPSAENEFTARIYLLDVPGGYNLWEFELYFVPRTPNDLDLLDPWATTESKGTSDSA